MKHPKLCSSTQSSTLINSHKRSNAVFDETVHHSYELEFVRFYICVDKVNEHHENMKMMTEVKSLIPISSWWLWDTFHWHFSPAFSTLMCVSVNNKPATLACSCEFNFTDILAISYTLTKNVENCHTVWYDTVGTVTVLNHITRWQDLIVYFYITFIGAPVHA